MITTLVVTKGSRKGWTVDETLDFHLKKQQTYKQTKPPENAMICQAFTLLTKGLLNQEHYKTCFSNFMPLFQTLKKGGFM